MWPTVECFTACGRFAGLAVWLNRVRAVRQFARYLAVCKHVLHARLTPQVSLVVNRFSMASRRRTPHSRAIFETHSIVAQENTRNSAWAACSLSRKFDQAQSRGMVNLHLMAEFHDVDILHVTLRLSPQNIPEPPPSYEQQSERATTKRSRQESQDSQTGGSQKKLAGESTATGRPPPAYVNSDSDADCSNLIPQSPFQPSHATKSPLSGPAQSVAAHNALEGSYCTKRSAPS